MDYILKNQFWNDHKKQLKSAFIEYFFKVNYLNFFFIDLDSGNSSKITIFSRWKLRQNYANQINITGVMNKTILWNHRKTSNTAQ